MKRLLISITLLLSVVPMYSMEHLVKGMFADKSDKREEGVPEKYKPEIRKVVYAVEKKGVVTVFLRKSDFPLDIKDVQIELVGEKENVFLPLSPKVD
ncbi:hypothetical protein E3J61_03675 [Candidatus Dependentiae bacterium]|nr:MAG: hypothetical protein E3J61_03675 [Candidatus Dependentiae bacterium]